MSTKSHTGNLRGTASTRTTTVVVANPVKASTTLLIGTADLGKTFKEPAIEIDLSHPTIDLQPQSHGVEDDGSSSNSPLAGGSLPDTHTTTDDPRPTSTGTSTVDMSVYLEMSTAPRSSSSS